MQSAQVDRVIEAVAHATRGWRSAEDVAEACWCLGPPVAGCGPRRNDRPRDDCPAVDREIMETLARGVETPQGGGNWRYTVRYDDERGTG
jgi:hypothetical protein